MVQSMEELLNKRREYYKDNPSYRYMFDNDVYECLLKLYYFLMIGDNRKEKDFQESFQKLNSEQKKYVRRDFLNIMNAQNEIDNKRKGDR